MNNTTAHKALREYAAAHRDIELAGIAIDILANLKDRSGQVCIKQLQAGQQRALSRMDAAAKLLGAPYES